MFLQIFSILALLIRPGALACEGECIVGITDAWMRNITYGPLQSVALEFHAAVEKLVPSLDKIPGYYGTPLLEDFAKGGLYDKMADAIFPGFFHGKCVDAQGNTPPGCPNPSCSVVCGTPGSLVFHYDKLFSIALGVARTHLRRVVLRPDSPTRKKMETLLVREAGARRSYIRGRAGSASPSKDLLQRFHELIDATIKAFTSECQNGDCDWEEEMKSYILTFP
ncbi:hypothetical protein BDN71DRAFT_1585834 [Pleurotus eryngii]|uniref:Uncharacterized protein n=1 Tax=Pleurotus eryngii TaxID=5323 RepID=A0A9P6DJD6_PLEER|nr:hypothetical protein BDN71DRAFT_1585834 [Pleurotus eryngii]